MTNHKAFSSSSLLDPHTLVSRNHKTTTTTTTMPKSRTTTTTSSKKPSHNKPTPQETHATLESTLRWCCKQNDRGCSMILSALVGFCLLVVSHREISSLNHLLTKTPSTLTLPETTTTASTIMAEKEYRRSDSNAISWHPHRQRVPCQLELIDDDTKQTNISEHAKRFSASSTLWDCTQEISDSHQFLIDLQFQILECPPAYAASTFQLQASTSHSLMMGQVQSRHQVKNGCAIYNASVSVMDYYAQEEKIVEVSLYFTSNFKHYSNRVDDIQTAHQIKAEDLPMEQVRQMFTDERLQYLDRHLDMVPGFPKKLKLVSQQNKQDEISTGTTTTNNNDNNLPDCSEIPISDWSPVGVDDQATSYYNDSSLFGKGSPVGAPFRSARCIFRSRTLQQYNHLLAGLRIKTLGDSHEENIMNEARALMCPEIYDKFGAKYFEAPYKFDCAPHQRYNSFQYVHRFFRGIYSDATFKGDQDMMSLALRHSTSEFDSCQRILGLGLYNATVLVIPHWLFVYETNEGLDDFVMAWESLFEQCRTSPTYGSLFEQHVILIQSPTARDSLPKGGDGLDAHPAHSWRGIHNHRMETFTHTMTQRLGKYVDGIIPAFEMAYARMWTQETRDGVHLPYHAYRELLHVQLTAVMAALKFRRGMQLPIMAADNIEQARWWAPLELDQ